MLAGWFYISWMFVPGNSSLEDLNTKLKEELAAQLERFNALGKVYKDCHIICFMMLFYV